MSLAEHQVSVIVVNHNGRHLLADCLRRLHTLRLHSLKMQWHEVIVVDNASVDGSQDMVQQDFPSVRLIELESNLGFGVANNRGAAQAEGDLFLFLNSDAWLDAQALPTMIRAFDDPQLALVAPQLYYPEGSPQFTWAPTTGVVGEALQMLRNRFETRSWAHRVPPSLLRPLLGPGWLTAACWLMRREAFQSVAGFDEAMFLYFEDVDLSLRLRHKGWCLRMVPEARAFHIKGGSELGFHGELLYRRSQLYYYFKHRPAWENHWLRRRLQRKFGRLEDPQERRQMQALLEEPIEVSLSD